MKDTPTPRTDAAVKASDGQWSFVLRDECQQLERELAEMEEQCESWANQSMSWKLKADVLSRQLAESEKERRVLSHAAKHLNDRMAELQRERDNAESDMKQADLGTLRAMHQRNEARDQRDRLAEAARAVVDRWETPLWKDAPHTGKLIRALADALDAIEGGRP